MTCMTPADASINLTFGRFGKILVRYIPTERHRHEPRSDPGARSSRLTLQEELMAKENHSRRGFIKGAGLAAGGVLGSTILAETLAAQRGQGRGQAAAAGSASMSKGARFRAALASGEPLVLPVVEGIMLTRLCEI